MHLFSKFGWSWKKAPMVEKPNMLHKLASMPYPVQSKLFDKMSADELRKLFLSHPADALPLIQRYLRSRLFRLRFCQKANATMGDWDSVRKFFTAHGHLLRVATSKFTPGEVIDYLLDFFRATHARIKSCSGWSVLFKEALRRCSQTEFLDFINEFSSEFLAPTADRVFNAEKPLPEDEMELRQKLMSYFLEWLPVDGVDFRFRLSALARTLAFRREHRLIKLLGSPIRDGRIDYGTVVDEVIVDPQMSREILAEIPALVLQLTRTATLEPKQLRWSDVQVFNLIEMMTTDPEPWVLMNFACLLVSHPRLADLAIVNRARHSTVADTISIVSSCIEACLQLGMDAKRVLYDATHNLSDVVIDLFTDNLQQRA